MECITEVHFGYGLFLLTADTGKLYESLALKNSLLYDFNYILPEVSMEDKHSKTK